MTFARLFAVGLLLAVSSLGLMAWRVHALSLRLSDAKVSLEESRRLAGQILTRRAAPETATAARQPEGELSRRIEYWAQEAGIDGRQVVRIDPLSPRRIGDSEYLVEGADVELAEVTLPQLAQLASVIARDDKRLTLSQLRLTTPRLSQEPTSDAETWRVELALTYLRYSPKSLSKG